MTDKLTVEQLKELAHVLYEAWMADKVKVQEKYDKYLAVKERLDALREEQDA